MPEIGLKVLGLLRNAHQLVCKNAVTCTALEWELHAVGNGLLKKLLTVINDLSLSDHLVDAVFM